MTQVFAQVGQSSQQVGGKCPEGFIAMAGQRPDNDSIAQADGTWILLPRDYRHFTGLAKLDLFTEAEQEAVIAMGLSGDVQVKRFYDRLIVSDYVTYSDPQVEQGLQLLLARELLTPERKEAIVSTMTASRQ